MFVADVREKKSDSRGEMGEQRNSAAGTGGKKETGILSWQEREKRNSFSRTYPGAEKGNRRRRANPSVKGSPCSKVRDQKETGWRPIQQKERMVTRGSSSCGWREVEGDSPWMLKINFFSTC